jgi:hypothetical protein
MTRSDIPQYPTVVECDWCPFRVPVEKAVEETYPGGTLTLCPSCATPFHEEGQGDGQ